MMYEVTDEMPRHARVVLREPGEGWTRAFFDRQIAQYALDRGAPPRTATLHPETLVTLGFGAAWNDAPASGQSRTPMLVSSDEYERDAITLFE